MVDVESKENHSYYFCDTDFGVRIFVGYPIKPYGHYGLYRVHIDPSGEEINPAKILSQLDGRGVQRLISLRRENKDRVARPPYV